jgi:hypothetical protein
VKYDLYVGVDYTYTTTTSGDIGGEMGIKGQVVSGKIGVATTVNGSYTMEKKDSTDYILKATVQEFADEP